MSRENDEQRIDAARWWIRREARTTQDEIRGLAERLMPEVACEADCFASSGISSEARVPDWNDGTGNLPRRGETSFWHGPKITLPLTANGLDDATR